MGRVLKAIPDAQAILRAWMPFKRLVGVTSVRTKEDYARARATIDAMLEEVGDNEGHPLADVLDYLADQVKAYEDEHFRGGRRSRHRGGRPVRHRDRRHDYGTGSHALRRTVGRHLIRGCSPLSGEAGAGLEQEGWGAAGVPGVAAGDSEAVSP